MIPLEAIQPANMCASERVIASVSAGTIARASAAPASSLLKTSRVNGFATDSLYRLCCPLSPNGGRPGV